jgi:acetoacetyl-CoA synthetase
MAPDLPVWEGEISGSHLGCAIAAFDETGAPVVGREGELVVTEPMPSMPLGFWGDNDGVRFRSSYFGVYPGVWRHGDWIIFTERGSCIISGRSDATLNRGGVRLGTGEMYAVIEGVDGVHDSLVIHLEDAAGGPGVLVLLLVASPDESVSTAVVAALRRELSPRHVPDEIHLVRAIPTTLSGKKLEVPVKRILLGEPAEKVASREALRDVSALDDVVVLARTRQISSPEKA